MYNFSVDNKFNSKDKRIATAQWNEVQSLRSGAAMNTSLSAMHGLAVDSNIITSVTASNANLKIGEMYRELDSGVIMEPKAVGKQATLQRLLSKAVPVNIGKKVVESRRTGEVDDLVGRSMSGQTDIKVDHTASSYQGMIIPIFDMGYGRDWRDIEAQRSESFDSLSEDSVETEYRVLENINDYMWDGDAGLKVKGFTWLGIKLDPSIATSAMGVDWSIAATSATDILNDILSKTDVMRLTNNCTDPLTLAVSPQIMTNWLRPTTLNDTGFANIKTFIMSFTDGRIVTMYEDSKLSGNEAFFYVDSTRGFHAKTGMGMSSYAVPRVMHNDPYNFIKWGAFGFMAKTTFGAKRCALYAS